MSNGIPRSEHPAAEHSVAPSDQQAEYADWSGETARPLDRSAFDALAKTLGHCCLRAKGMVRFSDAPSQAYRFNLVGTRATLEPVDATGPNRLVAIGLGHAFRHEDIETDFRDALA